MTSVKKRGSSWKFRLGMGALGTISALLIAEAVFYIADDGAFPHLNLYAADSELGAKLVPNSSMKLRVADNPVTTVRINAQGFRGEDWPAPSGEEILVVGDSQVLGLGVEESETFSAQLEKALGGEVRVLNAGVPTYGPPEYRSVIAKIGEQRKPRRVVLVLNMANDLFEANRPNKERHAIWDGWAVRKETAPEKSFSFPGKEWLFNRSHAVFALRRFLAARHHDVGKDHLPSEGVFTDLISAGTASNSAKKKAELDTAEERKKFFSDLEALQKKSAQSGSDADEKLAEVLSNTDSLVVSDQDGYSIDVSTQLRAARANPGDIVGYIEYGEAGGPYHASASIIRRGAMLRRQLEKVARERFEATRDKRAEAALISLEALESVDAELNQLFSKPPQPAHAWSPLKEEIAKTQAITDAWGAELTVLILPFDVQVSQKEWLKYGGESVEMKDTIVLNEDAFQAAQAINARAVHPFAELVAAEPGAFLRGDLHLTPKGHLAVAQALAVELKKEAPIPLPTGGLPEGRTRAPNPRSIALEAIVKGSSAARCKTYLRAGWFRAICRAQGDGGIDLPQAVQLSGGLSREVQSFRIEKELSFVLPFQKGDQVEGLIIWANHQRKLSLSWPSAEEEPTMSIGEAIFEPVQLEAAPLLAKDNPFCRCAQERYEKQLNVHWLEPFNCSAEVLSPSEGCLSYSATCDELLACANGTPWLPPTCPEGQVNAGALERCYHSCAPNIRECPTGLTCEPWQGAHVCFPGAAKPGIAK